MKFTILIQMLFELLAKRKVTARYFAEKYEISERTVYRYVDCLSLSVPVYVKRGREGGITISDSYKLPANFMTQEEYAAVIEALELSYSQLPEQRFLVAQRKLSAQMKTEARNLAISGEIGSILVDGGTWGDERAFSDKLHLFEECIKNRELLEIVYYARTGEKTQRKIEPHVLVYKQNVWYVYAFCYKQRDFRLFRVGRVFSLVKTGERFSKRPFAREDIPLNFWTDEGESVDVKLLVKDEAFVDAQDWLGVENLRQKDGKWLAELSLPSGDGLVKKILGLGAGVEVLAPETLKAQVKELAEKIVNAHF